MESFTKSFSEESLIKFLVSNLFFLKTPQVLQEKYPF